MLKREHHRENDRENDREKYREKGKEKDQERLIFLTCTIYFVSNLSI